MGRLRQSNTAWRLNPGKMRHENRGARAQVAASRSKRARRSTPYKRHCKMPSSAETPRMRTAAIDASLTPRRIVSLAYDGRQNNRLQVRPDTEKTHQTRNGAHHVFGWHVAALRCDQTGGGRDFHRRQRRWQSAGPFWGWTRQRWRGLRASQPEITNRSDAVRGLTPGVFQGCRGRICNTVTCPGFAERCRHTPGNFITVDQSLDFHNPRHKARQLMDRRFVRLDCAYSRMSAR